MSDHIDCIVIGAGVVGLAIGRRMLQAGLQVVVLESEEHIGTHTSSRNSEVIHAGIYYPKDSLKARLCVAGRRLLYEYCEQKGVAHRRIGKLIVATSAEEAVRLDDISASAAANGVTDLVRIDAAQVGDIEANVTATAALLSPSTGIVDSHALMLALQGDIEAAGGSVVCRSGVSNVATSSNGFRITIGVDDYEIECKYLVNSAGLWATEVAGKIDRLNREQIPQQHLARGHYFSYQGKSPFSKLIYPVPSGGGLGIHATNDLSGALRFGPDVVWIDEIDYGFDNGRLAGFVTAIRRYFPDLDEARLVPAYTGIRPKLSAQGEVAADFRIDGPDSHGVAGLVNLYGIESPGLTSSLAIGDYVCSLLAAG